MGLSIGIYDFLETLAPYLVAWVALSTCLTTVRIVWTKLHGLGPAPHSGFQAELAAIPLTVLQTVGFVRAVVALDLVSAILFLWWGPGFIATVLYLAYSKKRKTKPTWFPVRNVISWACKVNYVAFMVVFFIVDAPGMMFVYSVWIISDQYGLAFLSQDADRLRRTFDDHWLFRVLYPAGLFVPFVFQDLPAQSAMTASLCLPFGRRESSMCTEAAGSGSFPGTARFYATWSTFLDPGRQQALKVADAIR